MKLRLPAIIAGRDTMGQFEQMVLSAIATFGTAGVHGIPLYEKVCEVAHKFVNQGSMYVALDRMERKHLISSWESDKETDSRGRPRRYYKIEPEGARALKESIFASERVAETFWSLGRWKTKTK